MTEHRPSNELVSRLLEHAEQHDAISRFSDEQHERLAGVLRDVRGMVMLSTYRSEMYDRLYTGWTCIERETHADGARDRVEQLWLNPACATAQRQQRLIA